MKKTIFVILLCVVVVAILGFVGYVADNPKKDEVPTEEINQELYQCLEHELEKYIALENEELIEIPLREIKDKDVEKIAYYKAVFASNHPENVYVMVYPLDGIYDADVMKDFDKYFYEKFVIYQESTSSSGPTIYIHTESNGIDFKELWNSCSTNNDIKERKKIPSKIVKKLDDTTKIVVNAGENELGIINDPNKVIEIVNAFSSGKQYGSAFLCDGHSFDFEMYDKDDKLIDTIYVWGDGNRFIPSSISGGCSYYFVSNDTDFRKIIEEETDYVFYNLRDYSNNCDMFEELIYSDGEYSYYLPCKKSNEVLVSFALTKRIMTLKYALNNNYLSALKVASEYPDTLIRKK